MIPRPVSPEFDGGARFQIVRRLGAGGAGIVYEAFDRDHHARVAIKVLREIDPEALRLFKNEFRTLRQIVHPNLVSLGELFEADDRWFFTMELLEGRDIVSYVRRAPRTDLEQPTSVTLAVSRVGSAAAPVACEPSQGPGPDDSSFDETRLRRSMHQVAQGLAALHGAGKVHRDVKASNVLVTREERVVLLDFGLVDDYARPEFPDDGAVVGTVPYMAPEQLVGQRLGPAADWYAFGVLLYRALTGTFPFGGTLEDIVAAKQRVVPTPPSRIARGIPDDLDRLCVNLLAVDPERRPSAAQILNRLGLAASAPVFDTRQPPPFVGRREDLAALRDALETARRGSLVTVHIRGESGIGKSALVKRFCDEVTAEGALVLPGRCDEREWVRYKAFDGIVDALARHLTQLPRADIDALLPPGVEVLPQVFPVLRVVEGASDVGDPARVVVNAHERRSRMAGALRELLARLSARQPLVVVVDDVQWADPDSLLLLRDLVGVRAPSRLLLVFTEREDTRSPVPTLHPEGPARTDVRTIRLGPLLPEEARSLAASLIAEGAGRQGLDADVIAAEASGHPLFIAELARYTSNDSGEPGPSRIEDALWARIQRLDRSARAILQGVSVAGGPLLDDVAAHAAAMDFAEFSRHKAVLRIANLVRSAGGPKRDALEPYHGQTRRAVLAHMDDAEITRWHARIALAMEATPHPDPEALATHWSAAGHRDRAARYMSLAAEQADASLAFERAVDLHERALALRSPDDPELRALKQKLALALANAGRGADAGAVFLEASEGAPEGLALELRRNAADQLLLSGRVEQGLRVVQDVLRALGTSLPRTPFTALLTVVWGRLLLGLRGIRYVLRDTSRVTPHTMTRLEVWWSFARGLGMVDTIRGAAFQARHLRLALRVGEPTHLLRALLVEATYSASAGWRSRARTERVLAEAAALAERTRDVQPIAPAWLRCAHGCAGFLEGRWRHARVDLEKTATLLRERLDRSTWEFDTAEAYLVGCDYFLGELSVLRSRVSLLVGDARARGDVYATTHLLSGVVPTAWLAQGDATAARQMADEAIAPWKEQSHRLAHFLDLQARATLDLYAGRGVAALERIRGAWAGLRRALFFRVEYVRIVCLDLLARALIAASFERPHDARAMRAEADAIGRGLARMAAPWAAAIGLAVRAGSRASLGDSSQAVSLLRRAASSFDACDMTMHGAIARDRAAAILGENAGAELRAQAEAWFTAERIRDRDRFVAALAPGYSAPRLSDSRG